jgi:hypothetical protein
VLNASTSSTAGRSFLAELVADAFCEIDASTLVQWWTQSSKGSARTIMAPLPDNPAELSDIISQLAAATVEATAVLSPSHDAGW